MFKIELSEVIGSATTKRPCRPSITIYWNVLANEKLEMVNFKAYIKSSEGGRYNLAFDTKEGIVPYFFHSKGGSSRTI